MRPVLSRLLAAIALTDALPWWCQRWLADGCDTFARSHAARTRFER